MPNLQRERIVEYLNSGKRIDGRALDEFREIVIERGISKNAESSVSVKIGKTEVFAGVKMAVMEPYPDSKNEGTFMTTVELHPMASNSFDSGKPGIDAVELARVVDRGIRESGFIDLKKLCIKEGEKVWQVFLDIVAINDDGNLMDACGLAALVVLGDAKLPVYDEEEKKVKYELSKTAVPLNKEALSFNITFHKIGESIIIDASSEEEAISDYRLSVAVGEGNGKARITSLQKGKAGAISDDDMERILKLVEDNFSSMLPKIRKYVFG